MYDFFNLADHSYEVIPMYGLIHLFTVLGMVILLVIAVWNKQLTKTIFNNKKFVTWLMILFWISEGFYWILMWVYKVDPWYERLPMHLCGSLSILLPILILKKKKNALRFFSYWALPAGFISFVNPSFVFNELWSWAFIHYCIRHYFVFLIPIIYTIAWDIKHDYRFFLKSLATMAGWAVIIFFVDWGLEANWLHLGPNNVLEVPFLPKSFTEWPWVLPSFSGVGVILFHLGFLLLRSVQPKN
jgi:hypothetical integral membrane protein (TIGR02206 family)